MEWQTWLAFFAACWVITISPGNGAVISMNHGLNYGVRHTTVTILGLQAGLVLVMALAMAGVGAVLLASEVAFTMVKWIGAAYLFYIGWQQWRRARQIQQVLTLVTESRPILPSVRQRFVYGFFTNATNPKGIVFMVAVLPQFIDSTQPQLPQFLLMAWTMSSIDLVVMHSYAFLAARMQCWFRSVAAQRAQQRFFGGLLMAAGVGVLWFKRSTSTV